MNILNLKKSGQSEFFRSKKPNQIWLSDITYIHTIKHGWTYLASVLMSVQEKIVGYSYGRKKNGSFSCYFCTDKFMAKSELSQ